jgi:hypothetical protein
VSAADQQARQRATGLRPGPSQRVRRRHRPAVAGLDSVERPDRRGRCVCRPDGLDHVLPFQNPNDRPRGPGSAAPAGRCCYGLEMEKNRRLS